MARRLPIAVRCFLALLDLPALHSFAKFLGKPSMGVNSSVREIRPACGFIEPGRKSIALPLTQPEERDRALCILPKR